MPDERGGYIIGSTTRETPTTNATNVSPKPIFFLTLTPHHAPPTAAAHFLMGWGMFLAAKTQRGDLSSS